MYEVKATGEKFQSFMAAVASAKVAASDVIEIATGIRRWTPPAAVSAKKVRKYNEHMSAHAAYKALQK